MKKIFEMSLTVTVGVYVCVCASVDKYVSIFLRTGVELLALIWYYIPNTLLMLLLLPFLFSMSQKYLILGFSFF